MSSGDPSLPPSWALVSLQDLLMPLEDGRLLHHGWSPQCEKGPSTRTHDWGVLKTTAVQDGKFLDEHNKRLPHTLRPRPQFEVKQGDILVTCAGPRARCGVVSLVRHTRPRLILSGKMYRFRLPEPMVDPRYLESFLRTPEAQSAIDRMKTGISDSGLNLTHSRFLPLPVRLAPSREQVRIVEALESFFTRLDDADATLKRVSRNLERYRASVLQSAVEGRLVPTEAEIAKMEGREYESGEELVARTCRGIVSRWLTRPSAVQSLHGSCEVLPELPEGWCWSTWAQLATRVTVGHVGPMKDEYRDEGIVFLRSQNIRPNKFDPEGLKRISTVFHKRLSKSALSPGDILVVRSGTVGTACVVPDFLSEANCSDMVVVQDPKAILPRFGAYYMNCMATLRLVQSKKVGIALSHFNTRSVASLPVPVPPLAEQERIVERTELLLSLIDEVEEILAYSQARCSQLRQAILSCAFDGRLVDQDPTDEPSSVLLERIHAERAKSATLPDAPRRRGGSRKPVKK